MDARGAETQLSQDEVKKLARLAGLHVSAERLPLLRAELESALRAGHAMDTAVERAVEQGGVAFDPAWSTQSGRTRS